MNVQRVALVGSVTVVVATVVAGLWLGGSPAEQRLLRFDEQRVLELRQLVQAARRHWDNQQRLPETAAELIDGQFFTRLPTDPVTSQPYEYRVMGPRSFEVCATFDRPSRYLPAGDFWYHEAGHRCFTLDVAERSGDGSFD
jgi:hypothetical protein